VTSPVYEMPAVMGPVLAVVVVTGAGGGPVGFCAAPGAPEAPPWADAPQADRATRLNNPTSPKAAGPGKRINGISKWGVWECLPYFGDEVSSE